MHLFLFSISHKLYIYIVVISVRVERCIRQLWSSSITSYSSTSILHSHNANIHHSTPLPPYMHQAFEPPQTKNVWDRRCVAWIVFNYQLSLSLVISLVIVTNISHILYLYHLSHILSLSLSRFHVFMKI